MTANGGPPQFDAARLGLVSPARIACAMPDEPDTHLIPPTPALVEARRGGYLISTNKALLDVDAVHAALTASYWSPGIQREFVVRGIRGALCFGVHEERAGTRPAQVGFARVITDFASFAYLADVYVLEEHRGKGLSKWLMETIIAHPDVQNLRRFCLMTRDAHGLYARYGFKPMDDPTRYMERLDREVYKRMAATQRSNVGSAH